MDELVLKQKLKALDKRAIEYLFDTYYEPLYLFCEKFIYNSDAAHDMVQSVFIKIWENSQNITFTGTIKSYLYVSVKNECLQYLRSLNIRDAHNQKWALAHIDSMTIDNMYDSM
ncbi:MAG: sigma factor, partial [Bacteroidales bacterium]